jgi:N-acetylglucosamine-6-phosphate deacetylase
MLDAFRNLVQLGLGLEEVVEMTSTRQADYLGRQDFGRIEPGARAGLVRLGKTLELEGVWIEGESVATSAAQPEPAPAS